jgi:DNA-binding NtrC family response regulator
MADEKVTIEVTLWPGEVKRLDNLARRYTAGDRSALISNAIAAWDGAQAIRAIREAAGPNPIRDMSRARAVEVDDEPDDGPLTPGEIEFLEGVLGPRTHPGDVDMHE